MDNDDQSKLPVSSALDPTSSQPGCIVAITTAFELAYTLFTDSPNIEMTSFFCIFSAVLSPDNC